MIEYICGEFGFEVEFGKIDNYVIEGVAREITALDSDGGIHEKEDYLKFVIKWDGCAEWNFGDQNGYIYTLESSALRKHCELLQFLYRRAFELMNRSDELGEGWEWMVADEG